jgi:hypothetical protein
MEKTNMNINIYKQEISDGIADQISSNSIYCQSLAKMSEAMLPELESLTDEELQRIGSSINASSTCTILNLYLSAPAGTRMMMFSTEKSYGLLGKPPKTSLSILCTMRKISLVI